MTLDWGGTRPLYEQCVARGMKIIEHDSPDGNVHFADYREAIFGGRPACFIPFLAEMHVNPAGLAQYGEYPGHVHELGHAVWTLLLSTVERWMDYAKAWGVSRAAGSLVSEYAATSIEEGWAEDFTVWFWQRDSLTRDDADRAVAMRWAVVARIMQRLLGTNSA